VELRDIKLIATVQTLRV